MSNPDPISSHYQPETQRFGKNFASADQEARKREREMREKVIDTRRMNRYNRDMDRWQRDERLVKDDAEKIRKRQEATPHRQPGISSVGYNLLNGVYQHNVKGSL